MQIAEYVVGSQTGSARRAGFKFIVGSRQSKAPIDLEPHFRWHGDAFGDGQVIDTITPKRGANTALDLGAGVGAAGHATPNDFDQTRV